MTILLRVTGEMQCMRRAQLSPRPEETTQQPASSPLSPLAWRSAGMRDSGDNSVEGSRSSGVKYKAEGRGKGWTELGVQLTTWKPMQGLIQPVGVLRMPALPLRPTRPAPCESSSSAGGSTFLGICSRL